MNRVERCFLNSLGCAMRGSAMAEEPALSPEEWEGLFRLAGMHHVLPLVLESVRTLPELQGTPQLAAVRRQVRQQVFLQTRKTADFLSLLRELDVGGVHPLVVKGIVCRSLYPLPDHRFSSDEDLLVLPEELDACREIFDRAGLATAFTPEQQADSYEIPYRQPEGVLYIELHKSLFPPESDSYGYLNRFFSDAAARSVSLEVSGVTVPTLGYTDHLFYLICHALKHFLHSGFGIRQICDILLYAQVYGDRIDWPALVDNCRQIHALDFAAALFAIGRRHLDFSVAHCPAQLQGGNIDELPMLEDLLQAGVYGSSSESRMHSSNITLEAVASRRQSRTARNSVLLSLFPPAQKLEGRYPYLKERPWLLPAAWASRMGGYCRSSLLQKPSAAADSLKLGNRRVALLNYYNILDGDISEPS